MSLNAEEWLTNDLKSHKNKYLAEGMTHVFECRVRTQTTNYFKPEISTKLSISNAFAQTSTKFMIRLHLQVVLNLVNLLLTY